MADNITLNAGSGGSTLATDDDGTAHHQYVKVEFGADNTQTPVNATNPLPVDASGVAVPITDNGGSLTVDGAVTANAGTNLNTSALALEATQTAMSAKLPTVLGQKTKATALGVTLASDEDALTVTQTSQPLPSGAATETTLASVDAKITACNTGAVVVASGAITEANSGTIAGDTTSIDAKLVAAKTADLDSGAGTDTVQVQGIAVAASGGAAIITGDAANGLDVDVTRVSGTVIVDGSATTQPISAASLPLPSGAATEATLAGTLTVDGSAVTQPVSAASLPLPAGASTSTAQTDGTQKSQIVDASGDVMDIAEEGVTLNTTAHKGPVLMAEASAATPARANGAVAPLAVDTAGLLFTRIASALPAGSNTIGTVTANAGTGPWPVTDNGGSLTVDGTVTIGTALPTGTNAIGKLAANSGVDIGDVDVLSLPAGTKDYVQNATFIKKTLDWTGAVTGSALWTPAAGKKFVVTDIMLNVSAACTVTLFDSTDTTGNRILKMSLAANGGLVSNYAKPVESATADNVLKVTTSATGGFITVSGFEV